MQQAEGRAQQAEALVQQAEVQVNNNRGAADLMSQMINAGHIAQDSENTIIIKGAKGEQRFGVNEGPQQAAAQVNPDDVFLQEEQDQNA